MLIDITQNIFECKVFPGDPAPSARLVRSFENGDFCNLTEFSMCAHNGTHVDAPLHFIRGGKSIGEVGIEPFVGDCCVARHDGDVLARDAERILAAARAAGAAERILIADAASAVSARRFSSRQTGSSRKSGYFFCRTRGAPRRRAYPTSSGS